MAGGGRWRMRTAMHVCRSEDTAQSVHPFHHMALT